jgi:5-(carboxyamino)imidazole ribonucleotide synthase
MSNNSTESATLKLGILGGGPLSVKLCQAALSYNVEIHVLDPNPTCPASEFAIQVHAGKYTHLATVVEFGKKMDLVTSENLKISLEALKQLENEGTKVAPQADGLEIIKDRGLQKKHFNLHSLSTLTFKDHANSPEIQIGVERGRLKLPFIQKARQKSNPMQTNKKIHTRRQIGDLLEGASYTESLCDIHTEFKVLISSHQIGLISSLSIDSEKEISEIHRADAFKMASTLIKSLEYQGALSISIFLSKKGLLYLNKVKVDIGESHLKAILGLSDT